MKSNWIIFVPLVFGIALTLAAGCGGRKEADTSNAGTAANPQRIVCGTPAVAEIVFALGCGDAVVGVSDYTVYPPAATLIASIGGWANPNRERLLALNPDIIVTQGEHQALATFTREYGMHFHAVKLDNMADIYTSIASIAAVLGKPQKGMALIADIQRAMRAATATIPDGAPKRVLLLFGRTPGSLSGLGTTGPGTFLDDMIRVAGATNLFGDAMGAYPQISKEALLVRQPEVILELHPGGLAQTAMTRLRADWQVFADLPAVRDDRIHYMTNDFLLIPGPRIPLVAQEFIKAIHAENP